MNTFQATGLITLLLLGLGGPAAAESVGSKPADTGAAAKVDPEAVVATVNGKKLTEEMLQVYGAQRARNPGAQPITRDAALEELINIELVTQDAEKHNIDKRPNIVKQLDWQRRSLLVGVSMREYITTHPVTDAEVEKLYKERIKNHDGSEYHARHILVKSEGEAKAIIADLDKGGDFAKLATEKSTDPSGKQNGGDLGWFSADQMVEPFSKAVAKLKKGEITQQPVQTQFGWHVIKLEETRKSPAPTLESLKEQLQMQAQNQRIDAYLAELRKDAKIDVKK